jgi:hypothetical protein
MYSISALISTVCHSTASELIHAFVYPHDLKAQSRVRRSHDLTREKVYTVASATSRFYNVINFKRPKVCCRQVW